MTFAAAEPFHGFFERQAFQPVFFFVFSVADLIHNVEGITAFGIDRFVETDGVLYSIKRIDDHFFFNADFFCNFFHGRFFQVLADVIFFCINSFVGNVAQGAADTYAVIIPQITADFTDDHRNCISRKFDHQGIVKIINRLHKAYAANLKQVIGIFVAVLETSDNT